MADTKWLLISGAARSGTTVLEQALAQDNNIAIIHEIPFIDLMISVGGLVRLHNPARLPEYERVKAHLFSKDTFSAALVHLFRFLYPSSGNILGVKDPEWWLRKKFYSPLDGFDLRQINILRNPSVVIPKIYRIISERPQHERSPLYRDEDASEVIWACAWNNSIEDRSIFGNRHLDIFYEDIQSNCTAVELKLSTFLSLNGIDLRYFKPQISRPDVPSPLKHPMLRDLANRWDLEKENILQQAEYISFPLMNGSQLDFRDDRVLRFAHIGFFSPESNGTWVQEEECKVIFNEAVLPISARRTVEFKVVDHIPGINLGMTVVLWNGVASTSLTVENNDKGWTIRAEFERYVSKVGTNIISIRFDHSHCPFEAGTNTDFRVLSVLIETLVKH